MRSEKSESIRDLDLLAASDSMIQAMSERLAEAVKIAGGRPAVVAKTGITNTTLWRLLKGQQPKHAYMVAIAKAAGVSLDWLTTGNGPKMATDSEQEIAPPPASRGRVLTLEMADISALSALVERAGGIEQAAEALKLPPEELRAIIASGRAAAHTVKAAERLLHLPHLPNDPATPLRTPPKRPTRRRLDLASGRLRRASQMSRVRRGPRPPRRRPVKKRQKSDDTGAERL